MHMIISYRAQFSPSNFPESVSITNHCDVFKTFNKDFKHINLSFFFFNFSTTLCWTSLFKFKANAKSSASTWRSSMFSSSEIKHRTMTIMKWSFHSVQRSNRKMLNTLSCTLFFDMFPSPRAGWQRFWVSGLKEKNKKPNKTPKPRR